MKQIQGKSFNIVEDVVGRITFGKKMFHRSNEIWVSKDATHQARRLDMLQQLRQRTLFQIMENLIVLLTMWTNFMKEML